MTLQVFLFKTCLSYIYLRLSQKILVLSTQSIEYFLSQERDIQELSSLK